MSRTTTIRTLPARRLAGALLAALVATSACSRDEETPATTTPAPAPAADPAPPAPPAPGTPPGAAPSPQAAPPAQGMAPNAPGEQDAETLAQALNDLRSSDPAVRADAVLDIEPEGVGLRTLVDTLRDPDKEVRLAVVSQLEDSESPDAVAGLVRALQDSDPEVVLEAIDALEFVGDANVVGDLRRLLDSPNPEVKEAAQDAIEYLEEE